MPTFNQLAELTHEELKLMLQNRDSKNVVTDPLERFIIYTTIIAQEENRIINIKFIQAQSHQSFYCCNQAVKKLIDDDWISLSINQQDKRNRELLPTKKSLESVRTYEGARANSIINIM